MKPMRFGVSGEWVGPVVSNPIAMENRANFVNSVIFAVK